MLFVTNLLPIKWLVFWGLGFMHQKTHLCLEPLSFLPSTMHSFNAMSGITSSKHLIHFYNVQTHFTIAQFIIRYNINSTTPSRLRWVQTYIGGDLAIVKWKLLEARAWLQRLLVLSESLFLLNPKSIQRVSWITETSHPEKASTRVYLFSFNISCWLTMLFSLIP